MSEQPKLEPKPKSAATTLAETDMLSSLQATPAFAGRTDADRRLLVFRKIAAPLMAVVTANKSASNSNTTSESASQFAALIDTTIALNQQIAQMLNLDASDNDGRWQAAAASSEIVAAHYRATSQALTSEEASAIISALRDATMSGLSTLDLGTAEPREKESNLGHSLKALAPVASAIARFSFGRDPMELLAEVVQRLTQIAIEVTEKLASPDEPATGSALYYAVLEVAGEFYMESHFGEMDRLLEMAPEERKEYVQAHNRRIPMEPVWERLGLKMGMLEALTAYLPGGA